MELLGQRGLRRTELRRDGPAKRCRHAPSDHTSIAASIPYLISSLAKGRQPEYLVGSLYVGATEANPICRAVAAQRLRKQVATEQRLTGLLRGIFEPSNSWWLASCIHDGSEAICEAKSWGSATSRVRDAGNAERFEVSGTSLSSQPSLSQRAPRAMEKSASVAPNIRLYGSKHPSS
jgi:hypothetical protein